MQLIYENGSNGITTALDREVQLTEKNKRAFKECEKYLTAN